MLSFVLGAILILLPFILLTRVIDAGTEQVSRTVRKPASWIKPQQQIRTDYGSEAEQRSFGQSVKAKQLQPLVCLSDGTLVCGYRRYHCGSLAGMTHFDVLILDEELSESQIKIYRLTENIQRKDLTAWEMYQSCFELLALNPQWQLKDLAAHLNYDPASITRYLAPSKCIHAWREALRLGNVGISDVYVASKLPEAEQMALLDLKRAGGTRDQLEAKRKSKQPTSSLTIKLSRARFPVGGKSGVVVTVTGPDMTLGQYVESLQLALDAAKKSNRDNLDIKTAVRVWADRAKADERTPL